MCALNELFLFCEGSMGCTSGRRREKVNACPPHKYSPGSMHGAPAKCCLQFLGPQRWDSFSLWLFFRSLYTLFSSSYSMSRHGFLFLFFFLSFSPSPFPSPPLLCFMRSPNLTSFRSSGKFSAVTSSDAVPALFSFSFP